MIPAESLCARGCSSRTGAVEHIEQGFFEELTGEHVRIKYQHNEQNRYVDYTVCALDLSLFLSVCGTSVQPSCTPL